jgi:hypothetical protein
MKLKRPVSCLLQLLFWITLVVKVNQMGWDRDAYIYLGCLIGISINLLFDEIWYWRKP